MYRKSVLTGDFEFAVNREFEAVERAFASFFDVHRLQKLYAEPSPRFDGMIAFADGTTWNPGSGEGVYRYDASSATWIPFEGGGGGGDNTQFGSGGAGGSAIVDVGVAGPAEVGFDYLALTDENDNILSVNSFNSGQLVNVLFEFRGFKPIHGVFLVDSVTQQRELPAVFTSSNPRDYLAFALDTTEGFSTLGLVGGMPFGSNLNDPDSISSNGPLVNSFTLTDTGTEIRFDWLGTATDGVYLIQFARSTDRPY